MCITSVSIVTITQYSRFDCLKNLYEVILQQDYSTIDEWIIVEGSQTEDLIAMNSNQILDFIEKVQRRFTDMHIIYLCEGVPLPLSNLRNLGNNACSGDIIVCMDDDDYYPPSRVSHAVESLNFSNYAIAGCSGMYMYDYFLKKLYKFRGYHNHHSTNNCMAFTREYLKTHSHKEDLHSGEEYSFTNGFTEPMYQLNPLKCIVVSSHDKNTYNKRDLIIKESMKEENSFLYEIKQKKIETIIPPMIFERMQTIFTKS